jgi:hypothetical protein
MKRCGIWGLSILIHGRDAYPGHLAVESGLTLQETADEFSGI